MIKNIKIAIFLAIRQIKNANFWVTSLIVFIMTITFLNLVFISGILEGLVIGASNDLRSYYSGDIIITPEEKKINIINSKQILDFLDEKPEIKLYSYRYVEGVQIKNNYDLFLMPNTERNTANASLVGINFEKENKLTNLEKFIIKGDYIFDNSRNKIIIGSGLLSEYDSAIDNKTLEGVEIGDKIKISIIDNSQEYVVAGILKSKISQINSRIFIDERDFLMFTGRSRQLMDEIALTVDEGKNLNLIKEELFIIKNSQAKIETWQENQGQFFKDLSTTFTILGAVIGAIGLIVASITLFIVIFINAISREKYIGILRGIGINNQIIKYSYILQSLFYAILGSFFGILLLCLLLVPYFERNPIDFPFSDGILHITNQGIILRILILLISSVAAGLIPSQIIIKKNIIDSILGR